MTKEDLKKWHEDNTFVISRVDEYMNLLHPFCSYDTDFEVTEENFRVRYETYHYGESEYHTEAIPFEVFDRAIDLKVFLTKELEEKRRKQLEEQKRREEEEIKNAFKEWVRLGEKYKFK